MQSLCRQSLGAAGKMQTALWVHTLPFTRWNQRLANPFAAKSYAGGSSGFPANHGYGNMGDGDYQVMGTSPPPQLIQYLPEGNFKTLTWNEIRLIGNLGSNVTVRTTSNGKRVGKVSMAVSSTDPALPSTWYGLNFWDEAAEEAEAKLSRGNRVYVRGRIAIRSWTSPAGAVSEKPEVTVSEIHIVERTPR